MSVTFDLYFNKIMLLCDTMVIKHSYLAKIINQGISLNSNNKIPIDSVNPQTWKYYMNLAGEYHQYDKERLLKLTDGQHEYMRIKIAGDYEPIEVDFTRDLLNGPNADPATANEYKYGTQYYKELVARYPDFEELILGIIYPVDYSISIPAKDGTILRCGEYRRQKSTSNPNLHFYSRDEDNIFNSISLIEEQEDDLIPDIQRYIDTYLSRWINHDFVAIDDLYFHTIWSIMFALMPSTVINSRLRANKTNQVHTYHIRELLDSHGYLGRHVDHLNIDVVLWLYRNIEYLDAYMGMQETFDKIIENVFTKSGIPVRAYLLGQDSSKAQLGQLPELVGYEVPLNMSSVGQVLDHRYSVSDLLDKELGLARNNAEVKDDSLEHMQFEGARASGDLFNTKLLESTVVDYSNYIPYQIQEVLLNMWAYSISKGTYRGTAYVTHPKTGDRLQFTMLNAFILYVWCFNKGHAKIDLPKVPKVYVSMIPREATSPHPDFIPKLNFSQYRELVPTTVISDHEIDVIMGDTVFRSSFSSSTDFYGETRKIWDDLCRLYDYADHCQFINQSAYRHVLAKRKYWWGMELSLPLSGMSYDQWFTMQNLDLDGLDDEDYLNLMTELFMYGTGFIENHDRKVKEIQKSCIDIMQHFSSYAVHFVSSNGTYAPLMSRDAQLKIDQLEFVSSIKANIEAPLIDTSIHTNSTAKFVINTPETFSSEHIAIQASTEITIPDGSDSGYSGNDSMQLYLPDDAVTVEVVDIYDL